MGTEAGTTGSLMKSIGKVLCHTLNWLLILCLAGLWVLLSATPAIAPESPM